MAAGKQDVPFTAVGYGLQQSFLDAAGWKIQSDRVRMLATPKLLQINVPGFTGNFSIRCRTTPTPAAHEFHWQF